MILLLSLIGCGCVIAPIADWKIRRDFRMTRDLAALTTAVIKWAVGTAIALVALTATIVKFVH